MKLNNNLLSGGLIVVLLVVIGGIWISFNYVYDLSGAATSHTGTTNVTVTAVTSCAINDSLISFGEMANGEYNQSIELNTTGGAGGIGDFMMLTNDGNTNITITVENSVWLWSTQGAASAYWAVRCENVSDGNSTCTTTWQNVPAAAAGVTVVSKLTPVANAGGTPLDNVTIGFNLTVPSDEPTGYHNGTVTFTCSAT